MRSLYPPLVCTSRCTPQNLPLIPLQPPEKHEGIDQKKKVYPVVLGTYKDSSLSQSGARRCKWTGHLRNMFHRLSPTPIVIWQHSQLFCLNMATASQLIGRGKGDLVRAPYFVNQPAGYTRLSVNMLYWTLFLFTCVVPFFSF